MSESRSIPTDSRCECGESVYLHRIDPQFGDPRVVWGCKPCNKVAPIYLRVVDDAFVENFCALMDADPALVRVILSALATTPKQDRPGDFSYQVRLDLCDLADRLYGAGVSQAEENQRIRWLDGEISRLSNVYIPAGESYMERPDRRYKGGVKRIPTYLTTRLWGWMGREETVEEDERNHPLRVWTRIVWSSDQPFYYAGVVIPWACEVAETDE